MKILFKKKNNDIFNIFAQRIDCWYKLEPLRRGGSNEYPQSMFWLKNKKKNMNTYTCRVLEVHYTDMQSLCILKMRIPTLT